MAISDRAMELIKAYEAGTPLRAKGRGNLKGNKLNASYNAKQYSGANILSIREAARELHLQCQARVCPF